MTGRAYYLPHGSFENLLKGLRTRTGTDRIRGTGCDGPRFEQGLGRLEVDTIPGDPWCVYRFSVGAMGGIYRSWEYVERDGEARRVDLLYDGGGSDSVYER